MMAVPRRPKRAAGEEVVIPTNGMHPPPPGPAEPAENGAPKLSPPPSGDPNALQPPPASAADAPPPGASDASLDHALPNASSAPQAAANGKAPAKGTAQPTAAADPPSPDPATPTGSAASPTPAVANGTPQAEATLHPAGVTPSPAADSGPASAKTDASPTPHDPPTAATVPLAIPEPNGLAKGADSEGPRLAPDPGLYAVLGLSPSASDAEIQTNYRRQAARLLNNGSNNTHAMRELNVAYEVLGNPARREEYDRARLSQSLTQGPPTPIRTGAKVAARVTRRTRPRHAVQPRYAGLPDVLAVIVVVGLAVLAGTLIIPRLSIDLSPLKALQNVLPLSNSTRRVIDATVTPAPTSAAPTATPRPGVVERFAGTAVSVSNPNPAPNSQQSVVLRLRRDGQPAANFDVWSLVKYTKVEERWPPTGSVKTDASGAATITFNIGDAFRDREVTVRVFVQADDQQLTWSTSFTPR
jgi:hypothetical protein